MTCPRSCGTLLARGALWRHVAWLSGPAKAAFKLQRMTNGTERERETEREGAPCFSVSD